MRDILEARYGDVQKAVIMGETFKSKKERICMVERHDVGKYSQN